MRAEWLAQLEDPTLKSVAVRTQTSVPARATFCAPHLTGHGFSVLVLQPTHTPAASPFAATDRQVENEYFRIGVEDDGSLRITDKQTGLVLPHCNCFVDDGDRGDEYNFDPLHGEQAVHAPSAPPSLRIDASHPAVAALSVTQRYAVPRGLEADREMRASERVSVPITTRVRLYAGIKRLDFDTIVDNQAADHRLRVHFQTPLVVESAFMEQAFGTVERRLALEPPSDFEQPVGTVPQKTFTCIQADGCGVALFNRGIPEVEVRQVAAGTEIALTLIRAIGWLSRGDLRSRRGPAGPGLETPDAQCFGQHRFQYALTTFVGDWETAGVVAQAHAFAYPPIATTADAHPGPLRSDAALVECDNPSIVLSALTPSRRPRAFLVRWYNSSPRAQVAEITIPLAARIRAVNFLEAPTSVPLRRVRPQRWRVHFRPFEIVTLRAQIAPR